MKRFPSPFDTVSRTQPPRVTSAEHMPQGMRGIYKLGASVIDLVPPQERRLHHYWRGASLGAIAYNLMRYDRLNTAHDLSSPRMHFANGPGAYSYADQVARSIALGEGYSEIQFPHVMREDVAQVAGARAADQTPGVVFALHPDFNDYVLRPSDQGACEGVIWDGAVTLDMIDEHTRLALEQMLTDI